MLCHVWNTLHNVYELDLCVVGHNCSFCLFFYQVWNTSSIFIDLLNSSYAICLLKGCFSRVLAYAHLRTFVHTRVTWFISFITNITKNSKNKNYYFNIKKTHLNLFSTSDCQILDCYFRTYREALFQSESLNRVLCSELQLLNPKKNKVCIFIITFFAWVMLSFYSNF